MPENERLEFSQRDQWLQAEDEKLLSQSRFEAFRAGGPGGQKQNKTSSAVRLTHLPSGTSVTAIESRSRRENTSKAISRLKMKIALEMRQPFTKINFFTTHIAQSNKKYPACIAEVLDAISSCEFRMSEAAEKLGISTAQLVKLLKKDPAVWQKVNEKRLAMGLPKLN